MDAPFAKARVFEELPLEELPAIPDSIGKAERPSGAATSAQVERGHEYTFFDGMPGKLEMKRL